MERILAIVFNDEAKAYEGSHALKQLDEEGSIAIHAAAVIKKNADGTVTLKEDEEDFPIRAVAGTAIGALIGLLEGPIGWPLGLWPAHWRAASATCTWRESTRSSSTRSVPL